MSNLTSIVLVLILCGCDDLEKATHESPRQIVDVYDEVRWGHPDGTTVVQCSEGRRALLFGKLGKPGEWISVKDGRCE